ncbi:uncharacterized protein TNCV_975941 [Trichonephila clavipes]|nr:uncharacterized protein TNCV_975941 [Trichonephila clavipes]
MKRILGGHGNHWIIVSNTWLMSERVLTSHCSVTRGLLVTDLVILNHGQVTRMTPEMAPPLLTTTWHSREDVRALDRLSVHRSPTRRVFIATGLELVTRPATIRYLDHSAPLWFPKWSIWTPMGL